MAAHVCALNRSRAKTRPHIGDRPLALALSVPLLKPHSAHTCTLACVLDFSAPAPPRAGRPENLRGHLTHKTHVRRASTAKDVAKTHTHMNVYSTHTHMLHETCSCRASCEPCHFGPCMMQFLVPLG